MPSIAKTPPPENIHKFYLTIFITISEPNSFAVHTSTDTYTDAVKYKSILLLPMVA